MALSKITTNSLAANAVTGAKLGAIETLTIVGTAPNQIPLNQYLGDLAYQDAANVVSLGIPSGSASLPSLFQATDTNTGVFFPAADTVGIATDGTERMRIDSAGRVGIGGTPSGATLEVGKSITGGTTWRGIYQYGPIQSDVTSTARYFQTLAQTQATSFTLTNLQHYFANQNAFGAGSAVTNQYGYFVDSSLTGATNNYGFYSNIASGTGRWNFYANGTAENYLGGNLKIGGTAARATTAGTNHLSIFNGTAPAGTLANGVTFYSDAGEAKVMDAAGNATLLSPHDPVTNEWIYYSVHTPTGKKLRIDMEKMMRFLNDHFDLDFIHEE